MDLATSVPGVDFSHYDDGKGSALVDYDVMVTQVRWAILRVGDGSNNDQSFHRHVTGLTGRIPIGSYFFCRPDKDAAQQAHAWANAVREAEGWGARFELGHWADLEDNDGVDRVNTARWIGSFLAAADAELGQPVNIYTSATWWGPHVDPGLAVNGGRLWWVARYPFGDDVPDNPSEWPAHVAQQARGDQLPQAPFGAPVAIWQWTSQGHGPAIGASRPNALDCNLMDHVVFAQLTGVQASDEVRPPVTQPAPTPQEDDMARLVQVQGDPHVYITDGIVKRWVADEADDLNPLAAVGLVPDRPAADQPIPIASVSQSFLDRLETVGSPPA